MRLKTSHILAPSLLAVFLSAAVSTQAQTPPTQVGFDFRNGSLGWQADFADYTPANADIYDLRAEIRTLPPELGVSGSGFYFQGNNRSDDLFMFMKRRLTSVDGIVAGQRYQIRYNVVFASNAESGCGGIGGAPGESVVLKAGATPNEPLSILDTRGYRRMNVNIGNFSQGGSAASVVSNIANGQPCDLNSRAYVTLQRTHQHTAEVTATSDGELWLLVGTDSGFEGLTTLYYQQIEVLLTPVGAPSPAVPMLLPDETTGRGVALDSVTMVRDPLPRDTAHNFSQDRRTRLTLFAVNAELLPGEDASVVTAQIEDVQNRTYPVTVEYVGKVPNFDWLTQVVVRLPDEVSLYGERWWLSISVRGAVSNRAQILVNVRGPNTP